MKYTGWLIEGANANAVGTVALVLSKPAQALFGIEWPSHYASPVRDIVRLVCRITKGNSLSGTIVSTLLALHAEFPDTKIYGFIRSQWQIGKDLT